MNYVLGGRGQIGGVLGRGGVVRAIAGDLDITQATSGIFTWTYDAADVADAGEFDVQFTATWDAPALSPARTFAAVWAVREALVVPD